MKKTIVFDFDGVIHSYTSGWKGDDVIPDEPVPKIKETIEQIRAAGYEVVVVSTRCANPRGLYAVSEYLADNGITVDRICKEKPPAIVYIDDRAICFDGKSDNLLDKIENFEPWYKKTMGKNSIKAKEVTQALRCCTKGKCGNCPFSDISDNVVECEKNLLRLALEVINEYEWE